MRGGSLLWVFDRLVFDPHRLVMWGGSLLWVFDRLLARCQGLTWSHRLMMLLRVFDARHWLVARELLVRQQHLSVFAYPVSMENDAGAKMGWLKP